jgi:hypothetical protein
MSIKKDIVTDEEIGKCLSHLSASSGKSAQEQFSKIAGELQITLEDSKIEDSIDGSRIRFTYTAAISRKGGGAVNEEGTIKFHYIKEIPIDYNKIPIRLGDDDTAASTPAIGDTISQNDNNNAILKDTAIIESYDELEKESVPRLYEVLGLLKRIYFMPEDFSNRLVIDRVHKLRNMFSKDEILTFPSVDPSNKAGLTPI